MSRPLPPPTPFGPTSIQAPVRNIFTPGNINLSQRIGRMGTPSTDNTSSLLSRSPFPKDQLWSGRSTVYSGSFEESPGRHVLIPLVIPDAIRGGYKVGSMEEAIGHYRRTGEHLGMFSNPQDAETYAQALHQDLAAQGPGGLRNLGDEEAPQFLLRHAKFDPMIPTAPPARKR